MAAHSCSSSLGHKASNSTNQERRDAQEYDEWNVEEIQISGYSEAETQGDIDQTKGDEDGTKVGVDLDRFTTLPGDLSFQVRAVVEETDSPLDENQEEDDKADNLVSRIEVFAPIVERGQVEARRCTDHDQDHTAGLQHRMQPDVLSQAQGEHTEGKDDQERGHHDECV